jgi:hypothetical protein
MSKVVELFVPKIILDHAHDPNTEQAIAIADIVESGVEICRAVREFAVLFGAAYQTINALDDTEARNRHGQLMKLSRETFANAALAALVAPSPTAAALSGARPRHGREVRKHRFVRARLEALSGGAVTPSVQIVSNTAQYSYVTQY